MLTIRKEQFESLSQALLQEFLEGTSVLLREQFPKKTGGVPDEALKQMIRTGIDKAAAYNITRRKDVCGFIGCMVRFGADFDDGRFSSQVTRILRTRNLSGAEKMARINDLDVAKLLKYDSHG